MHLELEVFVCVGTRRSVNDVLELPELVPVRDRSVWIGDTREERVGLNRVVARGLRMTCPAKRRWMFNSILCWIWSRVFKRRSKVVYDLVLPLRMKLNGRASEETVVKVDET